MNHSGRKNKITYQIMHMDQITAQIDTLGKARILKEQFLPYDLYLEEEEDLDTCINNLGNFYYWCASRVLSLDRKYAKDILNSIGMAQAVTDRDRAQIALSYHCVSLTDVYWVRQAEEDVTFAQLNLYDHSLNDAIVALSLRGRQMTVTNEELAPDLSTRGCFPKAWIRQEEGFVLLKDGGDAVDRELIASQICRCFDFRQVLYEAGIYEGQRVTKSRLITSKRYGIVSKMAFDIYACNHDLDTLEECMRVDAKTYYGMNILDYLVGNTDRHPENWGFLIDHETNRYVSLYPLMDFNQSFYSYDTLDGAFCQTLEKRGVTQREAALDAVRRIGLNQIREVDPAVFDAQPEWREMFRRRLEVLRAGQVKS